MKPRDLPPIEGVGAHTRADLLKRIRAFAGVIVELEVFDRVFRDVAFTYAPE